MSGRASQWRPSDRVVDKRLALGEALGVGKAYDPVVGVFARVRNRTGGFSAWTPRIESQFVFSEEVGYPSTLKPS